jgi:hypothetical protein
MPHYAIELIPFGADRPDTRIPEREERRFANLGEALERAREIYRRSKATAKGFPIFNAARELLHAWVHSSSPLDQRGKVRGSSISKRTRKANPPFEGREPVQVAIVA